MSSTIKPTLSVPVFGGEVTVHAFGAEHGCNFSFKGIDESPNAIESHRHIFDALASIPAACDYFAPSPVRMNAEIINPSQIINSPIRAWGYGRKVPPFGKFSLYRGAFADGLSDINVWNGYAMSSADCALVVVKRNSFIIAAHAGRESVIDMGWMKGGQRRSFESVVENICLQHPSMQGFSKKNVQVWVGFSISPGPHFEHERSSSSYPHNGKMIDHVTKKYGNECFADDGQNGDRGWLDLKELIRRQFMYCGVPEANITLDDVCTCTDTKEGDYLWYSNVLDRTNRNLIAVVKNP